MHGLASCELVPAPFPDTVVRDSDRSSVASKGPTYQVEGVVYGPLPLSCSLASRVTYWCFSPWCEHLVFFFFKIEARAEKLKKDNLC